MQTFIKNGAVELHAEMFGDPSDTPVLLIAGAMAPAVFWDAQFCASLVSSGYHVIRFDNRDIGQSVHFPQSAPDSGIELPYTIYDMVDDAKVVLDELASRGAHVIGHSLGGSIAQLFAVAYPERVRSLVSISAPILAVGDLEFSETAPELTEELWAVLMANPMYHDVVEGIPEFRKVWHVLNGDWALDEERAEQYTRAIYATEVIGPAWNHTHIQAGIRDIFPELMELATPILFIHGEKDYLPSNPENTKRLAEALPNAGFFLLQGGGHMFFNQEVWHILAGQACEHMKKHNQA